MKEISRRDVVKLGVAGFSMAGLGMLLPRTANAEEANEFNKNVNPEPRFRVVIETKDGVELLSNSKRSGISSLSTGGELFQLGQTSSIEENEDGSITQTFSAGILDPTVIKPASIILDRANDNDYFCRVNNKVTYNLFDNGNMVQVVRAEGGYYLKNSARVEDCIVHVLQANTGQHKFVPAGKTSVAWNTGWGKTAYGRTPFLLQGGMTEAEIFPIGMAGGTSLICRIENYF